VSDLPPELRRLLESAREAYSPDAEHLAKLGETIAAKGALANAAASAGALGKAGWLSTTKVVGLVVGVGAAGALLLIGPDHTATPSAPVPAREVVARETPRPVRTDPPAILVPIPPFDSAASTPSARAVRGNSQPAPSAKRAIAPAFSRERSVQQPIIEPRTPPQPATSSQTSDTDQLEREVALVRAARRALEAGNPSQALQLAAEHAALHPGGALFPERLAVRASALCTLGRRTEAREVARELRRVAPRSPHLLRLAKCLDPGSQ
jgi:hypothetical protein